VACDGVKDEDHDKTGHRAAVEHDLNGDQFQGKQNGEKQEYEQYGLHEPDF